jgi:hypothetical protein
MRGGCSSMVERRIVIPEVMGSNPLTHPFGIRLVLYFSLFVLEILFNLTSLAVFSFIIIIVF